METVMFERIMMTLASVCFAVVVWAVYTVPYNQFQTEMFMGCGVTAAGLSLIGTRRHQFISVGGALFTLIGISVLLMSVFGM
jgi:hypothetical protein